MESRPLDHESARIRCLRPEGRLVEVDFAARGAAVPPASEDAGRAGGEFPFALLCASVAAGTALGVAAWGLGAPGWSAALLGWLSPALLTPALPLLPVLGEAFVARSAAGEGDAEPAAPAAVAAHPRMPDVARWDVDLAAERGAAAPRERAG